MSLTSNHVVLGAGGPVAGVLTEALVARGVAVRLVSRRGHALPGAESVRADLLDADAVRAAIPGDATVYLVAGLRYSARVWNDEWPRIMAHAIDACAARQVRLVFFDNVYLYGRTAGPMTEQTPVAPVSRKGRVRARIAADLLEAARAGRLEACIARAADFYGPGTGGNSIPNLMVFEPLAHGKRPRWLGDPSLPHSYTYVPDCGRALVQLAEADDSWGRAWHLPTAAPAPTGYEFVTMAARAFGIEARPAAIPRWMARLAAPFNANVRESMELFYQYDEPYVFDSSAFERRFGLAPTPYTDGIAATARNR